VSPPEKKNLENRTIMQAGALKNPISGPDGPSWKETEFREATKGGKTTSFPAVR